MKIMTMRAALALANLLSLILLIVIVVVLQPVSKHWNLDVLFVEDSSSSVSR